MKKKTAKPKQTSEAESTTISFVEMYRILNERISATMDDLLLPLGFERTRKSRWERNFPHLRQSFSLFGDRVYIHLEYGFKILDDFDNLQAKKYNSSTFDYSGGNAWMTPLETKDIPKHVNKALKMVKNGIALFQKYKSVKALVRDYENKTLSASKFGEDAGWRHYTLGTAYYYCKEYEKAIEHFQQSIKRSGGKLPYIVRRKKVALHWIDHINQKLERKRKRNQISKKPATKKVVKKSTRSRKNQ